jgi:negative regulator of sigma E activity
MTMKTDQLSSLIDGEVEARDIDEALKQLATSADARESVTVFQVIGDAMRGRAVEDNGFSQRIFAALDQVKIER